MDVEQRVIRFTGRVQGVGFRYTACSVAGRYDLTGYVKNLRDGAVECLAEGAPHQIDTFLSDLAERMGGYIHEIVQEKHKFTGAFPDFAVRF